jgi:hypothetical protein
LVLVPSNSCAYDARRAPRAPLRCAHDLIAVLLRYIRGDCQQSRGTYRHLCKCCADCAWHQTPLHLTIYAARYVDCHRLLTYSQHSQGYHDQHQAIHRHFCLLSTSPSHSVYTHFHLFSFQLTEDQFILLLRIITIEYYKKPSGSPVIEKKKKVA